MLFEGRKRRLGVVAALLIAALAAAFWWRCAPGVVVLAPQFDVSSSLRFLAVGRQGYGNAMGRRIAASMEGAAQEAPTHAVLYLGDNFYPNGVQSLDDPQWESKFERLYRGSHLRGTPFFAIPGNHDHGGKLQVEVEYGLQRRGSARWHMEDHAHYVRDFGKVDGRVLARIVFLDTIPMSSDPAPQLEFARRAFAAPGDPLWRIVAGHSAVRSLTRAEYTSRRVMSSLLPQFQDMHVDLYVSADDHFQQILDRPDEPLHLGTNGGGQKEETGLAPQDPQRDFVVSQSGFGVITVSATRLAVELRDAAGGVTAKRFRERVAEPTVVPQAP